jgi:hypothetical protein
MNTSYGFSPFWFWLVQVRFGILTLPLPNEKVIRLQTLDLKDL